MYLYTQVKTWAALLNAFCTTGKLELELMYTVQVQCYEDAKLMKLFPEIIRSLYDQDVLAENTILHWFRKGTNHKGRYITFYEKAISELAFYSVSLSAFFFFHHHQSTFPLVAGSDRCILVIQNKCFSHSIF